MLVGLYEVTKDAVNELLFKQTAGFFVFYVATDYCQRRINGEENDLAVGRALADNVLWYFTYKALEKTFFAAAFSAGGGAAIAAAIGAFIVTECIMYALSPKIEIIADIATRGIERLFTKKQYSLNLGY